MRCWANRTTRRCALSICSSRTSKSAVLASVPAHLATRPSTCFYICRHLPRTQTDELCSCVFALPAINRCMSQPTCRGSRGAVRSHARSSSPRPSRPPASTGCRRTVTCWPIVFGGCTTPRCTRANPPSVARQVKSAAAPTPSETCLTRRSPGRQMRTSTCLRTLCRRWQLVARPRLVVTSSVVWCAHSYGQGSGKQPSVFGAGAAALMNPFGFGRSTRSTSSARGPQLGTITEGSRGAGSSSQWLQDAKSSRGFAYKGFRTLSYSPSLRAMGALALPDDEQPVPRPQISKQLDRYAAGPGAAGSGRGDDSSAVSGDPDELISPMRHATLSLSGLDLVRTRQSSSNVDTRDFPDEVGKGDEDQDEGGHEVVGYVCHGAPYLLAVWPHLPASVSVFVSLYVCVVVVVLQWQRYCSCQGHVQYHRGVAVGHGVRVRPAHV